MIVRVLFFAFLRERCGREAQIDVADGSTVGDVWTLLRARHPVLDDAVARFAVNRVYVDNAHCLHENDELALIPPVSGGCAAPGRDGEHTVYVVTPNQIDVAALLAEVVHPGAGAIALFVGTTRDENDGRMVDRLEYEAYDDMAASEMAAIGAEMRRRWPLLAVAMVHRVGVVPVTEASVAVAVAAPHREEAFAACRYGIDTLKAQVPIWKKEHYADGSRWIGACHTTHTHADADEGGG